MAVIVVGGSKGGIGKSSLSAHLCIEAMKNGYRVVLVDLDGGVEGQGSLSRWHYRRGLNGHETPQLQRAMKYPDEELEEAIGSGADFVIVDTPPGNIERTGEAIDAADIVVIPVRASPLDVESMDAIVEKCEGLETPFVFVMNAIKPNSKMTSGSRSYLSNYGEVLKQEIADRVGYASSFITGQVGQETETRGPIPKEIGALWSEIEKRVSVRKRRKQKVK